MVSDLSINLGPCIKFKNKAQQKQKNNDQRKNSNQRKTDNNGSVPRCHASRTLLINVTVDQNTDPRRKKCPPQE